MFLGCNSLKVVNLYSFDTSNVMDMSYMFASDAISTSIIVNELIKIYVSPSFVVNQVNNSENMFYKCKNILGEYNTGYDNNFIDKTRAIIDEGDNKPGYFANPETPFVSFINNTYSAWGIPPFYDFNKTIGYLSKRKYTFKITCDPSVGNIAGFEIACGEFDTQTFQLKNKMIFDTEKTKVYINDSIEPLEGVYFEDDNKILKLPTTISEKDTKIEIVVYSLTEDISPSIGIIKE